MNRDRGDEGETEEINAVESLGEPCCCCCCWSAELEGASGVSSAVTLLAPSCKQGAPASSRAAAQPHASRCTVQFPPLQHGRQQRRHCVAPRAVTRARAAAAELPLFIPGQMGTKWPFMPPKDPIVLKMRMHESTRVYRRFLDFPLKRWRCFHVLDVPNEST